MEQREGGEARLDRVGGSPGVVVGRSVRLRDRDETHGADKRGARDHRRNTLSGALPTGSGGGRRRSVGEGPTGGAPGGPPAAESGAETIGPVAPTNGPPWPPA